MRRGGLLTLSTMIIALSCAQAASADRVFTIKGAPAPGPARYDRVKVIEQGPRHARNILVLVPGTSGGAAYFRPVARALAARLPGWRVWSVDRRENRLEDHSVLHRALAGKATPRDLFRYYLEWLGDPSIAPHFTPVRLSIDGGAVNGGVANPAQKVLGVPATHGDDVRLPIYAIETSLGAGRVLKGARRLAKRSHAARRLVLVDRHRTYDHIDPLSAVPAKNAFVKTVVPFLRHLR